MLRLKVQPTDQRRAEFLTAERSERFSFRIDSSNLAFRWIQNLRFLDREETGRPRRFCPHTGSRVKGWGRLFPGQDSSLVRTPFLLHRRGRTDCRSPSGGALFRLAGGDSHHSLRGLFRSRWGIQGYLAGLRSHQSTGGGAGFDGHLTYLVGLRKPRFYTLLPAIFMGLTTIGALVYQGYNFFSQRLYVLGVSSLVLILLALFIISEARGVFFRRSPAG